MIQIAKLVLSLALLVLGGLVIAPTALAYSVPQAIRTIVQLAAAALTIATVACIWLDRHLLAATCMSVAVLMALAVIFAPS